MAARHLLDCGLRHFGYVGLPKLAYVKEHCEAFATAVAAAGHGCHVHALGLDDETTSKAGHLAAWLRSLPKPVGVLTWANAQGRAVLDACRQQHLLWAGAIACGYIGLRHDRIAALWKGFHACQHYDGSSWNGATMPDAIERASRFQGKAIFQTDNSKEKFQPVMDVMKAQVTWANSGLGFHSTAMFLDDRPSTLQLREWFQELVTTP